MTMSLRSTVTPSALSRRRESRLRLALVLNIVIVGIQVCSAWPPIPSGFWPMPGTT